MAEIVEGRASPKGNGGQPAAVRTLSREAASTGLASVRQAAQQSRDVRFTALLHHITIELLKQSYLALKHDAAPGIDGVTWQSYGENLEEKLKVLHDQVHRGSYRAHPAKRSYIPKPDGRQRPLAVAASKTRSSNWRPNGCRTRSTRRISSGSRMDSGPGAVRMMRWMRSWSGIESRKVNFILDADIHSFFDTVDQEWLIRFVEHRVGDRRIVRLIRKWLKAGVLEDGIVNVSDKGTGQGR